MLWIGTGLFAVGVACGASIRLPVFVVILFVGAVIAVVATVSHGIGTALLAALTTVIALQIGYVAGLILRAVGRSLRARYRKVPSGQAPANIRLREKRR